ncbi:MAG: hypothetical protein RBG13Loki_4425 [Promethearchaeota archaeon CR_4]|nr:MAG: hypothetical protein RBG13Loki_4425 [Candidatus Lokiarchaeota archaeon CR_4]
MAGAKDGRRILSLSTFLVTLPLAVLFGYITIKGGFWSGTGDLFLKIYVILMGTCGGFAFGSCLHLIMAPKRTQQPDDEDASRVVKQKGRPLTKENIDSPSNFTGELKPRERQIKVEIPPEDLNFKVQIKHSTEVKQTSPVTQNASTQTEAVRLTGPVVKNKHQFLETVMKLANIAKICQDLVENEKDLSKKEQTRLSLQRREFKQLYATVKNSRFDTF